MVFFFKQKTAYEMRISDWSSDVCSSDLLWWRKMSRVGTSSVEAINLGSCSRGLVAGTAATDQSRSFISASVNVQYCMQLPVRQRVKPAINELYHRRSLLLNRSINRLDR